MFDWYTEDQLWLLRQETGFTALPNEEQPDEYQLDRGLLKQVSDRRIAEGWINARSALTPRNASTLPLAPPRAEGDYIGSVPVHVSTALLALLVAAVHQFFMTSCGGNCSLALCPAPLDRQAKIIKFLRDHPDDSS